MNALKDWRRRLNLRDADARYAAGEDAGKMKGKGNGGKKQFMNVCAVASASPPRRLTLQMLSLCSTLKTSHF
jgi:hypothetical protein